MRNPKSKPKEIPKSAAILLFVQATCTRLTRMLAKYIVRSDGPPPRKVAVLTRALKNGLGLKAPSVSISCDCDSVYTAQTEGSIETTVQENNQHIRQSLVLPSTT
jgi:hypothetical protein